MHNCKQTGSHNELIYICSRCGSCYQCKHKPVYFADQNKWMWKCKDGKFRDLILDGRIKIEIPGDQP